MYNNLVVMYFKPSNPCHMCYVHMRVEYNVTKIIQSVQCTYNLEHEFYHPKLLY